MAGSRPGRAGSFRDLWCDIGPTGAAEAVINYLQAVGIKARLRPLERAGFLSAYREKKLKNLVYGLSGIGGNAATRIEAFTASSGALAYGGYPDIDGLFREQAGQLDPKKREALLHRIQQLMYEKVMYLPIWQFAMLRRTRQGSRCPSGCTRLSGRGTRNHPPFSRECRPWGRSRARPACQRARGRWRRDPRILESMAEDDVRTILETPWVHVGSDGVALAPYGPTAGGKPHPRYYGTFARVLGRYVREVKLLSRAEAIHKMTGAPAAALGLVDRGVIREGFAADLTLFDPATVGECGTYDDPHRYASGIRTVIVNGAAVIDEGEHTGALPGRVLRRGSRGVA